MSDADDKPIAASTLADHDADLIDADNDNSATMMSRKDRKKIERQKKQ